MIPILTQTQKTNTEWPKSTQIPPSPAGPSRQQCVQPALFARPSTTSWTPTALLPTPSARFAPPGTTPDQTESSRAGTTLKVSETREKKCFFFAFIETNSNFFTLGGGCSVEQARTGSACSTTSRLEPRTRGPRTGTMRTARGRAAGNGGCGLRL